MSESYLCPFLFLVGLKNNSLHCGERPWQQLGSRVLSLAVIFVLLGVLASLRSSSLLIKHFSFQIFFLLLEMAQRDCSLHLSVILMCYNKNNFTSLTASLVHLLLLWRISATGYICVIVKKQRDRKTVTLKKKRENKKSPFFPGLALVEVEHTFQTFVLMGDGPPWLSVSLLP